MKFAGKMLVITLLIMFGATCSPVVAKDKKIDKKGTANAKNGADASDQKLVKMCTLESIEANQEFRRNVQIMQSQRNRVMQLQNQVKETQTKALKKYLQKELDAALEKLNHDNKKMVDTYGFSMSRNYVVVVEKAHVYMAVSDEEAQKIETGKHGIKIKRPKVRKKKL